MANDAFNFVSSSFASIEQDKDKSLWNRMMPFVGKLRRIDKQTFTVATLSSFLYHKSAPLLLSAGHILLENPSDMTSPFRSPSDFNFEVTYFSDGFTEPVEFVAIPTTPATATSPAAPTLKPDVAVFRGTRTPSASFGGTVCGLGDKVYVLGWCPTLEAIFAATGNVSTMSLDETIGIISAYADPGFSGSPVANIRGSVVGMVQGSAGVVNHCVRIEMATRIHDFLLGHGLPGFEKGL